MLKASVIENLKSWLSQRNNEKTLKALINQLLPFFRVSPAFSGSRDENISERRQLLAEFLCLYKQRHGSYILMGEFPDRSVKTHLLRRLSDFAMNCRSEYRQALISRVNSVVRPAHGFKKKKGRIVGRIADVDNNIPTSFDEAGLWHLWKSISPPPAKSATALPAIKDLVPVVSAMFGTAEGWVFKSIFYYGFERILGLVEPTEHPFSETLGESGLVSAIEEMAQIPAEYTNRVALAQTLRQESVKMAPRVKTLLESFSSTWLTICRCMLIEQRTAADTSEKAGISQQGCGKASRTIARRLRAALVNLNQYEQLAFVHLFVKKLCISDQGGAHE